MKLIGFASKHEKQALTENGNVQSVEVGAVRKSVVRVYFQTRELTLSYYNDLFDLKRGDFVYVDGKLEGLRGRVVEVEYNFKIKLSEYKRVIAKAETGVKGKLYMASSHFVSFDRGALPMEKVKSWFTPPESGEEYVTGGDDEAFSLDDLGSLKASGEVLSRGNDYYRENRVVYLSVDGTSGYALVEGSHTYEVEFKYREGEICSLTCGCFCTGTCKHEVALVFQIKEILAFINEKYASEYKESGYFAAIGKASLFIHAIDTTDSGSITLA